MSRSPIVFAMLFGLMASSLLGCTRYHAWSNDLHVKKLACRAYDQCFEYNPAFKDARHYERGWKQGYIDVANGGDGAPPTFPPVEYRSFKYRSPEGHQIIDLWFEAYAEGANAAFSQGVDHWNYIPTSKKMRSARVSPVQSHEMDSENSPTSVKQSSELEVRAEPQVHSEEGELERMASAVFEDREDVTTPEYELIAE